MTDEDAFMQLVLSNAQSELSPLEIGIHALEAVPMEQGKKGGGLQSYADQINKTRQYVSQVRQAAEVLNEVNTSQVDLRSVLDKAMHLSAIHAADRELWPLLVEMVLDKGWSAADTEHWVKKVSEFDIPEKWQFFLPPLLVLSNAQSELSPLEIGCHALEAVELGIGGKGKKGGIAEYARQIGKSQPYVLQMKQAADVLKAVKPIGQPIGLLDKAMHLSAIHAADKELWPLFVEMVLDKGWSAADTEHWVKKVSEFDIPEKWQFFLPPLLVLSNAQSELSPLEIGMHALQAVEVSHRWKGGGLKDYALEIGKTSAYVTQMRQAAEVARSIKLT